MTGTALSTTFTAALAIGIVVGGSSLIADRANSVGLPNTAPAVQVETSPLILDSGFVVSRAFVGQVEAAQQADLAFEAAGTLKEILVEEGQRVTQGQVLAQTDTRALLAQRDATVSARAALEAQLELARLTTSRQEALEQKGFSATQRFDEARLRVTELLARIDETDAQIQSIDVALDKSTLRSPFDGRVAERHVDLGQTVNAGMTVVSVLENASPRLRVGLPADIAQNLKAGSEAVASVGGETFTAKVVFLRPDLDPRTRTRTAVFELAVAENQTAPAFGQSGQIRLEQHIAGAGSWVPLMALREGVNGSWTILTVDGENLVRSEAVELLHTDESRAFVRGSFPEGTALIASGPHRVVPGQQVRMAE
jgi:RND family efflux transporter MFP subunit